MFLPYSSLSEGSVRSGLKLALPMLFHSFFHHFVDDNDHHHRFLRPPNLQKVPFLPQMAHLRFGRNCHRLVQLSWTNCNHTLWPGIRPFGACFGTGIMDLTPGSVFRLKAPLIILVLIVMKTFWKGW